MKFDTESPIIEWSFSEFVNKNELVFRDQEEKYDGPKENIIEWINKKRVKELFKYFLKKTNIEFCGNIVDLGAGSCWLSSLISKFEEVEICCGFFEKTIGVACTGCYGIFRGK